MTHMAKLIATIAEECGVAPERITPETSLRGDLALDSLDLVSLASCVEREFDVALPQRFEFVTVSDVAAYLEAQ